MTLISKDAEEAFVKNKISRNADRKSHRWKVALQKTKGLFLEDLDEEWML